jgi:hypothetical protein
MGFEFEHQGGLEAILETGLDPESGEWVYASDIQKIRGEISGDTVPFKGTVSRDLSIYFRFEN